MLCKIFKKSYFSENFIKIVSNYSQDKINFINIRYIRIIKNLEKSASLSAFYYYLLSTLITVLSIVVPSLISIQERTFKANATEHDKRVHSNMIFWIIWCLSILITISNALLKLFSLDKKYISRSIRLNQLRSEGVMYVNGIEDYFEGSDEDKFKRFVQNIEKIKNIQINQEFTQNSDLERKNNNLLNEPKDKKVGANFRNVTNI